MRRRRYLAALGGVTALGGAGLSARAIDAKTLSASPVRIYDAAVEVDPDEHYDDFARRLDRVDGRKRDAIASAIDGGYESDERWVGLGRFLERHRYVRDGGAVYRLSDTLPGLVVTAEQTPPSAVDGRIADPETFHEAVDPADGSQSFLARAKDSGYVDRFPRDRAVEFFETYAGVRFRDDVYALDAERRNASAPYTVTAEQVETAMPGVPAAVVRRLSSLPKRVREQLRPGLEAEHGDLVGLVDPPSGLLTALRAVRWLLADGSLFRVDAWDLSDLALSLSVEVLEAGMGFKNPARVAIVAENSGDRPLRFRSDQIPVGGILDVRSEPDDERRRLYPLDEPDSSFFSQRHSVVERENPTLEPGESARAEYAFGGDAVGVPRGTHVLSGQLTVQPVVDGSSDGRPFVGRLPVPFRIEFTVD